MLEWGGGTKLIVCFAPGKREDVLGLVFGFSDESIGSHLQMLRRLHSSMNDQTVFLKAVSRLVHMETAFDSASADKYM